MLTRFHALDALRAAAMFLGVLLHVALSYTDTPVPFWPVRDAHHSPIFDLFLLVVHDFRMQLFFLLAGFFGALLYGRYGMWGTVRHRLLRVALPLLLAMMTLQPALQAVSVYAASAAWRENPDSIGMAVDFLPVISHGDTPGEATVHAFTSGAFLGMLVPAHLWFLWYLLILFAVTLPLARIGDALSGSRLATNWDRLWKWILTHRLRGLVLALCTWPLLLPMQTPFGPDTPFFWIPPVHLVAYYLWFFLVGWTLWRHRDLLPRFAGGWGWSLLIAHGLALPLGAFLCMMSLESHELRTPGVRPWAMLAMGPLAWYTWLMIGGLTGLFLRCFSKERPWVRWAADSAYWCYLASLPPILLLQFVMKDWNLFAEIKFALVSAATMLLLLVSYQLCVRHTVIGRLLNGPRAATPKGSERSAPGNALS